jgi:TPR repeat protein/predicted Ser/Thr protein kinase
MFLESNLILPQCFACLMSLFTLCFHDDPSSLHKKETMEQQILNYRIEHPPIEGGMSWVYFGVHPVTGQKVAIKELLPHLATLEDLRERFRREAQFMARLNHPNIVRLIRYEESGNRLLLVLEYIEGINLEEYITNHRGPIPEEEAKELFCQLLEAFAYAHDNDVIHRDIKPSNIIITGGNQVKVIDFGIAKIAGGESGILRTKTGTRIGTVAYMSPEQVRGHVVDWQTDIYSLGVLFHQMLTGKAPYNLATESEFDVQTKIVKERLPRMRGIYEYISNDMQAIVDKATAKEKSARYGSCNEFIQAIKGNVPPPRVPPWWKTVDKRVVAAVGVVLLFLFTLVVFLNSSMPEQWKNQDAAKKYEQGKSLYDSGSYAEAKELFDTAASNGNLNAQYSLGYMYENGEGVTRNYAEAVKWYRLSGAQGSVDAQNNLGEIYYNGKDGTVNYAEAMKWYLPAAERGNMNAQFSLGYMYANSQGATQDYAEAIKWYRLAGAQGSVDAQNNLGEIYYYGKNGTVNYAEAVKWYRPAAERGNLNAQYTLGYMYENGEGVTRNYAEAIKFYRLAADQGNANAQNNLGSIYHNGQGVAGDYIEAIRLFRLSADQNLAIAQNNLGIMYEHGQGVTANRALAKEWYQKSCNNGNKDGCNNYRRMNDEDTLILESGGE